MKIIDLQTACYEIATAYSGGENANPFFVLTGAGLSAPNVPLAREIVAHCRDKTAHLPARADDDKLSNINEYSRWFDRAYPQPQDRQRYLRRLIEGKAVTHASLRLAQILASRKAMRMVVTSNFDDFVTRSLNIFGANYSLCDHPDTVDRINHAADEIQIVHVHGSYRFYDCRNLSEELESRARSSEKSNRTMASFLDRALSFSSPLVVGYAGWDGDVIMSALKRRLESSTLPFRLYWFCYRRSEVADLQSRAPWLAGHSDVRFVAPSIQEESAGKQPVLQARAVMDALCNTLGIDEPEVTQNPVRFFANQMRQLIEAQGDSSALGAFSFSSVIGRLDRAAKLEEAASAQDAKIDATIDRAQRSLRKARLDEAVSLARGHLNVLDKAQSSRLYDSFASYLDELEYAGVDSSEMIAAVDLTEALVEKARVRMTHHEKRRRFRRAMLRGNALYRMHNFEQCLDALAYAERWQEPERDRVVVALLRANVLGLLGRRAESIAQYKWLLSDEAGSHKYVVTARYGLALEVSEDGGDALKTFVDDHIDSDDIDVQESVLGAVQCLVPLYLRNGAHSDAQAILASAWSRFGASGEAAIVDRFRQVALTSLQAFAVVPDPRVQQVLASVFGGFGIDAEEVRRVTMASLDALKRTADQE